MIFSEAQKLSPRVTVHRVSKKVLNGYTLRIEKEMGMIY